MEIKRTYEVGQLYVDFTNLRRVGEHPRPRNTDVTIEIYNYVNRFYNATLRFKREEGAVGFQWRLTEIWDSYSQYGKMSIDTIVNNPNVRNGK